LPSANSSGTRQRFFIFKKKNICRVSPVRRSAKFGFFLKKNSTRQSWKIVIFFYIPSWQIHEQQHRRFLTLHKLWLHWVWGLFLRSCKTIINQSTNLKVPTTENTVISNKVCSWQCLERRAVCSSSLAPSINQTYLDIESEAAAHPKIFKAPGLSQHAQSYLKCKE